MKRIEVERIADYGHALGASMKQEYDGLYAPADFGSGGLSRMALVGMLRCGRLQGMSTEINMIRPQDSHNLAVLTDPNAQGYAFGLMTKQSFQTGQRLVHTGVITHRTQPGELHIMPLMGGGVPLDRFSGIDELGRIMAEIGGLIQQPGIGSVELYGMPSTPGELGHALQAVSALTDASTLAATKHGVHIAHSWNAEDVNNKGQVVTAPGPAIALTARQNGTSLFAAKTDSGEIQNGFLAELVITDTVQDYILIDHASTPEQPESGRLGVSSTELAMGMGMAAASSQLERSGVALEAYLMGIMRDI